MCEGRVPAKAGNKATDVLGIGSLVFSCLFMAELTASIWAFGLSYVPDYPPQCPHAQRQYRYFKSWFHCLDATVIIAGFFIDVLLKGVLEEVGTLVVVLRLWRVFKIIEELSAGAEEQMEPLEEHLQELQKENEDLRKEVTALKQRRDGDV